jgi:hypothetical protein
MVGLRMTSAMDASESGDGEPRELPDPFVPDEEWLDAFERQTTADLVGKARRYATKHARWIERAGDKVEPMDLVLGVLDDTRAGVLRWTPAACSLEAHVILAIGSRARHLRERARRFPHRAIDPDRSSDPDVESALASNRDAHGAPSAAFAGELLAALRALAADDADVHTLLDAYERHAFTRQDVMALTRWPKGRYRNAKLRLDRMVDRLIPVDPMDVQ